MADLTPSDSFDKHSSSKKGKGAKQNKALTRLRESMYQGAGLKPDSLLNPSDNDSRLPLFLNRRVLLSALAWMLLAACTASFFHLGNSIFPWKFPDRPSPALPEKGDLELAVTALEDVANELLHTWQGVSPQTQKVFEENFLPKDASGKPEVGPLARPLPGPPQKRPRGSQRAARQAPQEGPIEGPQGLIETPFAVYSHHVFVIKRSFKSMGKKFTRGWRKAALARRAKLVKAIIEIAIKRLRGLEENGNFARSNKVYSALLEASLELPSEKDLQDPAGAQTSYEEYQAMVAGTQAHAPSETVPKLPWPLAKKLVDTLRLQAMQLDADRDVIVALQGALPCAYRRGGERREKGTKPTQEILKGPIPEPTPGLPGYEGPPEEQGGPPSGPPETKEAAPCVPSAPLMEGLTEVPEEFFEQSLYSFADLGVEEMGLVQRQRRMPIEWTREAAVKHLKQMSESQDKYLAAVRGLKQRTLENWESDLGKLPPFDLAVIALSLL